MTGGYTILTGTDNLTGTADATVTPSTHTYTGFTPASGTPTSGQIEPDGSKVFEYKYKRNSYELTVTAGR